MKSIIDKKGISKQVLTAISQGKTLREVAGDYGVSKGAIQNYLKSHEVKQDLQKPLTKEVEEKIEVFGKSIFNVNERLQDIYEYLTVLRDEPVEFSDKLSWLKESREQIKLAANLIKYTVSYEEAKKFRLYLLEEIGKESEDVKQRIIRRIDNACRAALR